MMAAMPIYFQVYSNAVHFENSGTVNFNFRNRPNLALKSIYISNIMIFLAFNQIGWVEQN